MKTRLNTVSKHWVVRKGGRGNAKFTAHAVNGNGKPIKSIPFGDKRYSDYTLHKDKKRKELYLRRHAAREDWDDLSTKGAWSRWLLWNKPDIEDAVEAIGERFGIDIMLIY